MNSPDVAAALHAGAPDAAGQLYDAHAQALFQYCWLTLRNRQHAQTAVCDALVQAGARVADLSDPGPLRAWLFTLARAECHFHPLPSLGDTDEAIARPEQPDAALRIMAWNSVMSLDLLERQALDLNTRHGMTEPEIGLILSLPLPGATELLASARETLGRALGAQILVGRDSLECPGRTEAIHGWTGTVTPAFRDRLLEHAGSCRVCRPKLPQNVSPGRIFGLLPAPVMDSDTRSAVMTRVSELVQAELAEAEPAPWRLAAGPSAPRRPTPKPSTAKSSGPRRPAHQAAPAPAEPEPPAERKKRRRPGFRVFAGLGAALAAVAVAAGLAYGSLGSSSARLSGADTRLVPGTEAPAQAGTGRLVPRPDSSPVVPSPRSQAKRSTLASPAAGAGAADSVAGGKQATSAPHRVTRMIVTQGQGAHRAVVVPVPSTASSTPASPHATQTTARLTVSPASLSLGGGSHRPGHAVRRGRLGVLDGQHVRGRGVPEPGVGPAGRGPQRHGHRHRAAPERQRWQRHRADQRGPGIGHLGPDRDGQ